MTAYRDYCLLVCNLALSTTRQRMTYICKFYDFALKNGTIDRLPFSYEERIVKRKTHFLAHAHAGGGKAMANDLIPRSFKTLPKYLSISEVKLLLAAIDNPHHLMMIRLALHTGLRREEISTFPQTYVFDPDKARQTNRNLQIRLDPFDGSGMVTKGRKPREIYLSRQLMSDLYRYKIKIRGERASLSKSPHNSLFLNHTGKCFSKDGKSLNRIVSEAGRRAGLRVHFHLLRHTYATQTLASLQRNSGNGIDPLVFLQRQLGHESIETTMVYLHIANHVIDNAVLAYDDELNELAELG